MATMKRGKDGSVSIENALHKSGLFEPGGGLPYQADEAWVYPNIGPLEASDGYDHPAIGSLPERPFTPQKMKGSGNDPNPSEPGA